MECAATRKDDASSFARRRYNNRVDSAPALTGEVEPMPMHDWTRVNAGIFHDFHHEWISTLKRALNSGVLPPDFYALAEQVAGGLHPDVVTLERDRPGQRPSGG